MLPGVTWLFTMLQLALLDVWILPTMLGRSLGGNGKYNCDLL